MEGWSCPYSPILIDPSGDGFRLTGPDSGVLFDIRGRGVKDLVAWTAPGSDDAFLALDRNGNGMIDDVTELFGDNTPQPSQPGQPRNAFIALAAFDGRSEGGNEDGVIDRRDAVYSRLRLWQDRNRNGASEPDELLPLETFDVTGAGWMTLGLGCPLADRYDPDR